MEIDGARCEPDDEREDCEESAFVTLAYGRVDADDDSAGLALPTVPAGTLMLAQAMVLEADMDAETDHAALGYALKRRAEKRGIPIEQEIREYVAGFKAKPNARIRWILALTLTDAQPRGYPSNVRWRPDAWMRVIDRAIGVLEGTLGDPCGATQYGGKKLKRDRERAARAVKAGRWVLAACSKRTLNNFYTER